MEEKIKVLTEYNVRYILAADGAVITKQDGTFASCRTLLPSAYFTMELKRNESGDFLDEIFFRGLCFRNKYRKGCRSEENCEVEREMLLKK